jgi:hypothetical protein
MRSSVWALIGMVMFSQVAFANGHGPVFVPATPTLGKGGWQVDQAWFGRLGDGPNSEEQTLRTMISFGITEDVQISASIPIRLVTSGFMPNGRMMASMSSAQDLEGMASWRFYRRALGAGSRVESTVTGSVGLPLGQLTPDGMQAAVSAHLSAATGYVSRSHYVWVGGGYEHHDQRGLDRMGDVVFLSGVYGYRPAFLRLDYPKPDLRFFVETLGERTEQGLHHGVVNGPSGGTALFVGPTALLLYKAYALEGGVLFPLYQNSNGNPNERFRFAVNASYFFWRN